MTDRIDEQPAPTDYKKFDKRSGKSRRKVHTMVDPDKDRRSWNRRKKSKGKKP